ncbi:MAG: hypothetical protein ABWW65_03630 [Thermoprotei archaeon]
MNIPAILPDTMSIRREGNTIIIDFRPKSRVVSFKIRDDLVRKLDTLIEIHCLGSRSRLLKKLVEALVNLLDETRNGTIRDISLEASYVEGSEEKTVRVSIRL